MKNSVCRKLALAIACVLALSLIGSCNKEVEPTTGKIQGIVTDASNNEPIQGVNISLSPTGLSAVTGSDGRYEFVNIEAGQYTIQGVKKGYQSNTKNITIVANNTSSGDMMLTPELADFKLNVDYLDFGSNFSQLNFKVINTSTSLPINWSITENQNWLTATPSTGTLNAGKEATVQVKIDRNQIDQSISTNIKVEAAGKAIILPVNVTISGSNGPLLQLSESTLDFGSSATSLSFYVMNAGPAGTTLNWTCSNVNVNWLTLTPTSGNTQGGSSTAVMATIDRSKIDGVVSTTVTVNGAGTSATLTVTASTEGSGAAILQLSEGSLNFGENLTTKTFLVKNVGSAGTTLDWFIVEPDVDWLTLTPMTGHTNSGSGSQVTAAVDRTKFHGTVSATVKVNSQNNSSNLSVTAVNKLPLMEVSTETVDFGGISTTQTFTISNVGDEGTSLQWNMAAPTVDWLTASPLTGKINAGSSKTITLTIDRTKITGDVTTTLSITAGDQNVMVTVTATTLEAVLTVTPTSIDFGKQSVSKTITIKNDGEEGSTMNWSISNSTVDWLSISQQSGSLNANGTKTVTLTLDRSKFEGDVTTNLTVSGAGQQVNVSITASTPQSNLDVTPTTVDFGKQSVSETITIKNDGEEGSTMNWSISSPTVDWLSVSHESGSLNANATRTVTLTLDRSKFTGDVSTELTVSGAGQQVKVNIAASTPQPNLAVTPTTVDFGKQSTTETIIVKNDGQEGSVMNWNISNPLVNWLSVSSTSGNLNANATCEVTLTIDRTKFDGDVSTELTVSGAGQQEKINITASTPQPSLEVTPTTIDFGKQSTTKTITVKNKGEEGSVMSWNIPAPLVNWLMVSPASGSLNANATREVTLTIDRTKFEGDVSTTITVTAGGQSATVNITASSAEATMSVPVTSIDFGVSSTQETFQIKNTGETGSFVNWTISTPSVNWLTASPMSGTAGTNSPSTVTLNVDRNLFSGVETTEITVTGANSTATVTITVDNRVVVTNGMIAYYNFDDGTVTDWSSGYNGFNQGAMSSSDTPNGDGLSMEFDGVSSYLQIPYMLFPTSGAWSYNLWFKTTKERIILGTNLSYAPYTFQGLRFTGQKLEVHPAEYNYWTISGPISTFLNNQWHMLTVTFTGNVASVYIDGALFETCNHGSLNWWSGCTNTYIGTCLNYGSNNYFEGKMDNIRTYNRALTVDEVRALFNAKQ